MIEPKQAHFHVQEVLSEMLNTGAETRHNDDSWLI